MLFHAKIESTYAKIVFPSGLLFDKESNNYRTPRVNVIVELMSCFTNTQEPIEYKWLLTSFKKLEYRDFDPGIKRIFDDEVKPVYLDKHFLKKEPGCSSR